VPGVFSQSWFNDHIGATLLPQEHVTLPTETQLASLKAEFWNKKYNNFMYVKLHGSYGWKAHDGSMVMVVGQGKQGKIDKEPLLRWYLSLFEDAVNEGDKNLIVIGYGFADEHINNIIANAVHDHGLRLYIISPQLPADFQQDLSGVHGTNTELKHPGDEIWKGLHGYYRGIVTDFYRAGNESLPPCGEKFFRDLEMF
jgi:SIR2-like domain